MDEERAVKKEVPNPFAIYPIILENFKYSFVESKI